MEIGREHAAAANDLFNKVFQQRRSLEHQAWKLWRNPAGPPVGYVGIAADDGRALSMNIGLPKKLRIGRQDNWAIQICESASDPDAPRGGRIFHAVTSAAGLKAGQEHAILAYGGQSTDAAIKIGRRWLGYRVVFALQVWERRLSLRQALRSRLGTAGNALAGAAGVLDRARATVSLPRSRSAVAVDGGIRFDDTFDELWERFRDRYPLVLARGSRFLAWRYAECPIGRHHVLLARRGGTAEGYLVWREWEREGIHLATVLDLWDGRDPEVAQALLRAAESDATTRQCDFLHFAVFPGSAGEQAVRALRAFRRSEREPDDRVIATPLPIPVEETTQEEYRLMRLVIDPASWYYCQGDCDFLD